MLENLLYWLGFGLCHQAPERSFFGGGVQVPVCARDTGIYLGFVVSFVVVWLLHTPRRPRGFPRPLVWALMGVFLALLAFDGVTSYAGVRATTNAVRLMTGLLVGYSAAVVTFPMLQEEVWVRSDPEPVLHPVWRVVVWLATAPVAFAATLWGAPYLGVLYPVVVAVAIVATLALVNLLIISMLPAFDRRGERLSDLWLSGLLSVGLAFVEIAAAAYVRVLLLAMVR